MVIVSYTTNLPHNLIDEGYLLTECKSCGEGKKALSIAYIHKYIHIEFESAWVGKTRAVVDTHAISATKADSSQLMGSIEKA
jgi:hypothetical protein